MVFWPFCGSVFAIWEGAFRFHTLRLKLQAPSSIDPVLVLNHPVYLLQDELVLVYENGRLLKDWTMASIRERAELDIVKKASA